MSAAPPILIAGPTASGKSALALALARRTAGMVINADSQQVHDGWRLLTARPDAAACAAAAHRLYGHVPLGQAHSVGRWLADLAAVLEEARAGGLRPIVVGGTGLYFRALTRGLAPVPPVPKPLRRRIEARLAAEGRAALAEDLAARDPETAAGLDLANPRRIQRALEVLEATGRGLARWQAETPPPLIAARDAVCMVLAPPRALVRARATARFDVMLEAGLLAEVRRVAARGLGPDAPGMKAIGAPEMLAHLAGEMSLEAAVAAAKAATIGYARRQDTWFANQMADWPRITASEPETVLEAGAARAGLD